MKLLLSFPQRDELIFFSSSYGYTVKGMIATPEPQFMTPQEYLDWKVKDDRHGRGIMGNK
jgi:hypothetical protein